jgi:hypothetical protein
MLVSRIPLRSFWTRGKPEHLSDSAYAELVTMLLDGRLPIAVMALTIVTVGYLANSDHPSVSTVAYATLIVVLLGIRALIVTMFKRASRAGPMTHEQIRLWEVRYARVALPYAVLLGLFHLHVVTSAGEHVRLLVVAETFGYCAGIVARGFVRPQLCTLMMLTGALPTAVGFFILAAGAPSAPAGLAYLIVAVVFTIYAVTGLETVRHLYRMIISQLAIKRELGAFARVDPLTGLANRLAMREKLALEENRTGGSQLFRIAPDRPGRVQGGK